MHVGVTIFLTDQTVGPSELAIELESRGFESMFVPEHTHIPTSRQTPYPMGEPLPTEYWRTLDPFVALTAAASATTTLRIGTGIALVAQRDPIHFAKQVASLDHISQGRFICGIGFGWNKDELEHHGVTFGERRDVVRDRMHAVQKLWTEPEAAHDSTHASFSPSASWPKPVQKPYPPVLIGGGGGPKLFEAIADYGDGWMPIGGSGLKEKMAELTAVCESAGRDPDTLTYSVFAATPKAEYFEYLAELGVERAVVLLPPGSRDDVWSTLDRITPLLSAV